MALLFLFVQTSATKITAFSCILLFPHFIHTDRREAQRFKHLDQRVGRIQARHAGDIVLRRYPSDQEAVRSGILLAGHRVDHEVHPSVADDVHFSGVSISSKTRNTLLKSSELSHTIKESHSPLFWFQIITKLSINPEFTICNLFKTCDQSECS